VIVRTTSAEHTRAVGAAIATCLRPGTAVLLSGDLGSGKTTLAQGIAAGLGVKEPVVSPTFAIVREYEGDVPVAHVDVYRLERMQELHDLGFEEIIDGQRVVLLEWADLVLPVVGTGGARVVVRLHQPDDEDDDVRAIDVHALNDRSLDERLTRALGSSGPAAERQAR
jgi:tRNA threonylcarbamoyladenosine biosynthesis protein TsaE